MDLTTLPASEEAKAALKAALRTASEGLRLGAKIDLLAGAEWALSEVSDGKTRTPGPLPVGPSFLKGRKIVHDMIG